jgi:predicted nucleic acid-binding protein
MTGPRAEVLLYADSSAWVKRWKDEHGTDATLAWFAQADVVVSCRIAFVEVYRALLLADLDQPDVARSEFERDWQFAGKIEVDEALTRQAALLAVGLKLRSLDGLHLAAAQLVSGSDFALATWDIRLWQAARAMALNVLPAAAPA